MRTAPLALGFTLAAAAVFAAPPEVSHGRIEPLGGGGPLASRVESIGSRWVAWSIPAREHSGFTCSCSLDGDNFNMRSNDDDVRIAIDHHDVFVHLTDHRVDRIRVFTPTCHLEASGHTIYWIENVPPEESIGYLHDVARTSGSRAREHALVALFMQAGATDSLIDLARNGDHQLRGKALFWLSQLAGEKAAAVLRSAVDDPDEQIRGKAVFGISQLPNDESSPLLIELTKHRSANVRKKAIFWLGQKNDPRALDAIAEILTR